MQKLIATAIGLAMVMTAVPALADGIHVKVENKDTTVENTVNTTADTGGNSADGGWATTKIKDSGNITGDKNDWNITGGGTTDSDGGNGGEVTTGWAISTSLVTNDVNSTDIKVKTSCECDEDHIKVKVKNDDTKVKNRVTTDVYTGSNSANGDNATTKIKNSGNITGDKNDNNTTGGGTTDSDGGNGGIVTTGDADSLSSVINVVNSTVIRVRRIW